METFRFVKNKGINKSDFNQIFDEWYEPIRSFIYYKNGDIELAEDIAQETFLKLWENRTSIVKDTVKSLLYTMANNLFINRYDRNKTAQKHAGWFKCSSLTNVSPEYEMEMKEFDKKLQDAIGKLSEKNRAVFLMNRIDDMKYSDIAETLNLSVKAVEKRMSQALKSLRETIDNKI